MTPDEFITRATKRFKEQCPALTDVEALDVAVLLWGNGEANKEMDEWTAPEDLADDEMSYWDDDE